MKAILTLVIAALVCLALADDDINDKSLLGSTYVTLIYLRYSTYACPTSAYYKYTVQLVLMRDFLLLCIFRFPTNLSKYPERVLSCYK